MTYRANAKDVAAAISAAYDRLRLEGQLSPDTKINDLTPFLNYVSVYTGIMDDTYTDTNINCSNAVFACLKLHNGGTIAYRKDAAFGGTATTNALPIHFDPDGRSRMEQPTVPEKASLSSCTITDVSSIEPTSWLEHRIRLPLTALSPTKFLLGLVGIDRIS